MTMNRHSIALGPQGILQLAGLAGDTQQKAKEKYEQAQRYVEEGKKIAKVISGIKKTFDKIANVVKLGGSNDERFIARYYEIKNFLNNNGYLIDDGSGSLGKWLDKYDVRKTDVDDHKPQSYWYAAFQRLRLLFIDWMNYINPGLGTDYGKLFPEWKMVNEGQVHSDPIDVLKMIAKTYPRATYVPGTLLIDTDASDDIKTQQAGFGFWPALALCAVFGGLLFSSQNSESKSEGRSVPPALSGRKSKSTKKRKM